VKKYPDNMGKYGKGKLSDNGYELLDLCARNDLILTNTKFKHKLAHITTWQAPEQPTAIHHDGTPKRNPTRNQIDYIIVRIKDMQRIKDSRAHSNMNTRTDHRIVIAEIMDIPIKTFKKTKSQKKYDFDKLKSEDHRERYKEAQRQYINECDDTPTVQGKWDNIVKCCHKASEEVLGFRKNGSRNSVNPRVIELSGLQKELQTKINNSNAEECQHLRRERNRMLNEMHTILEEEKHGKVIDNINEVERRHDDSQKMYAAVKILQGKRKKTPILVDTDKGITTHEQTQVEIISDFFEKQFNQLDTTGILEAEPCEMEIPFTGQEIGKGMNKLSNNKAEDIDRIKGEHMKYSADEVQELVAEILNEMARTGSYPQQIKQGILAPLVKDKNKQGPVKNLRPVILLSIMRKTLAICLINRIGSRVEQHIPHSQAAYQNKRSTTELVFAYKILCEKAITSENYTAHILLMDMSKAFDTIDRNKLMNMLRKIINPDELHLVKILLEQVEYCVRVENTTGRFFKTTTGSPQGDCLSALFFILYLAAALGFEPHLKDHSYALPQHLGEERPQQMQEHNYSTPPLQIFEKCRTQTLNIDTQYADDCGHAIISEDKFLVNYLKAIIPPILKKHNLLCNEAKNEEHTVNRATRITGSWRKCKYLGSLLDTKCDIQRRKTLATDVVKSLDDIWRSSLRISTKMRIFDCLVRSIFMYNASLWTLTETMVKQIDSFQRKLLRIALNIRYPRIITNIQLMELTKQNKWSDIIATQRLRWFGHCQRLPEESPAKQALRELERETKRPRGRPAITWMELVRKQIEAKGMNYREAVELTQDRIGWRRFVNS
jgi:hypothetical protein